MPNRQPTTPPPPKKKKKKKKLDNGPLGKEKDWGHPAPLEVVEGVDGWWMVGRPYPGSSHAFQTKFGTLSTLPHPKVHDPSHKLPQIEERPTYPF